MYDLPPVTRALLIANVVVFLLELVPSLHPLLIAWGALWPVGPVPPEFAAYGIGFHVWQIVTYAFLHGSWMHIFFNMFALWMFGGPIEHLLGAKHYAFYYFFCAVTAAAAHLLVAQFFMHGFYPTLGASGAIFGLLVAFGVMYPRMKMFLIFLPIPMPAWVFVIGYVLLELFLGVTGTQEGVAHFAHLGGAVGGFLLLQYWRGKLPIKPRRVLTR
ncbi:MAG: hypothetical protein OJF55_000722 [Rhodanobacteraceae bacterium]|jgi:membrane associated rhomboid family serine protease|nr:MAG: hypothetical protein OJF55_000722 [Rhodanobacteraceae bacterium]